MSSEVLANNIWKTIDILSENLEAIEKSATCRFPNWLAPRHAITHGTNVCSQVHQPGTTAIDVVGMVPQAKEGSFRSFRMGVPSVGAQMILSDFSVSDVYC